MNRAVRSGTLSALLLLGIAILLLSACQPAATDQQTPAADDPAGNMQTSDDPNTTEDPASDFNTADPLDEDAEPTPIPLPATIDWNRDPSAIIFRAEITADETGDTLESAYIRNEVPLCTIYGDNRVVWTITNIHTDDSVVFDVMPDEEIRAFIIRLIVVHNFHGYPNSLTLDPDAADEIINDIDAQTPIVERLTLTINGETYITDSFSGWDYTYFRDVMEACRSISSSPIAYQPQGAWVTVRDMGYDPRRPTTYWDGDLNGLHLADLANGEPRWMTGEVLVLLWEAIRSGGIDYMLQENGTDYLVTVEVPNITRSSPPPPTS